MITVVDQVRPWLTPSSTLAAMTQPQSGAQISSGGIGSATSHPATSTGLRPNRSDSVPAKKLVTALTAPNARMNVSALPSAARWKVCTASSGTTVRSWPRVPPTSALTATSSENWARLARRPSRTPAPGAGPAGRARPAAAGGGTSGEVTRCSPAPARWRRPSPRGPPGRMATAVCPARSSTLAAVAARSPCPHMVTAGRPATAAAWLVSAPSSTLREPGRCPSAYSPAWRTSMTAAGSTWPGVSSGMAATGRPAASQAAMPPSSVPAKVPYPIFSACQMTSPRSWPGPATTTSGVAGSGTSQPSQVANAPRSAMASEPGIWPAA